jgi:iron complex transport system substrate-binding protein
MASKAAVLRGTAAGLLIAAVFAVAWLGRRAFSPPVCGEVPPGEYSRMISLAPSITESLFALGLGRRVVGVTRYCEHPPEVKELPRIGGYDNPSFESIVRLRPDLIVALPRHKDAADRMRRAGLRVLSIEEGGIGAIMRNLEKMARVCRAGERADRLISDIRARMRRVRKRTAGRKRPRVLVSVGRNMGTAGIRDVHIAGKEGFYDAMIEIAGGVNCYRETDITFPKVSPEGVTRLNPQVIIDMVDDPHRNDATPAKIRSQWQVLTRVSAVRASRVHVMGGNHVVVPGPRFILILEEMARLLHPDVDWGEK